MATLKKLRLWIPVILCAVAAVVIHVRGARPTRAHAAMPLAAGTPGGAPTSRDGLATTIAALERRIAEEPGNGVAAARLADALLRQARATGNAGLAIQAEGALRAAIAAGPSYEAQRMLGAVLASQHRFRDAIAAAERARAMDPADAWNDGVIGDAHLELGEYEAAFAAFDRMMALRPSAASYARVAYARELRGDMTGALAAMQMAASARAPNDPEAQAWYAVQTGELYLKMHRWDDADREYRRAIFVFPDYPLAVVGQGKLQVARGDRDRALALYLEQLKRTPTLDLAARIGDLYAERGDAVQSEHYYQLAEDLAGPGVAQTEANLALFLADHDRKLPAAVEIAETVAAARHDIFTEDALAWAYYKAGRFDEAYAASQRALRTGTRDDALLSRAARIRTAVQRHGGV